MADKSAEGGEMHPRMLESMGWLTESILIPRKGKAIEGVGTGTLVDLKTQYFTSQERARQEKESGEFRKGRKRKGDDDGSLGGENRGVVERDRKDRLHLKTEDEKEAASLAQLEKKAELYEQLAQGEGVPEGEDLYEVDFLEKRYQQHVKKAAAAAEAAPDEATVRKERREFVLEQAGLTKKGRERAAQVKAARALQQKRQRDHLKAAFIQKQMAKRRSEPKS